MKIYIVYQIQLCQFLILVLYSPVCACSVMPVKNINNIIYADMIESEVLPAVEELFPDLDCLFQDDEAVIHRTQHVLETVSRCFLLEWPPTLPTCCPLRISGPSSR